MDIARTPATPDGNPQMADAAPAPVLEDFVGSPGGRGRVAFENNDVASGRRQGQRRAQSSDPGPDHQYTFVHFLTQAPPLLDGLFPKFPGESLAVSSDGGKPEFWRVTRRVDG